MMRSSVVLPEPEGPSSATSSPVSTCEVDVVDRDEAAEALGDAGEFDAHSASPDAAARRAARAARPRT